MRVLIYGNRKQDDEIYDISTPEKENSAYLSVFKTLDDDWQVYSDLEDLPLIEVCEPCQKDLHRHCERDSCICDSPAEGCAANARKVRFQAKQDGVWASLLGKARQGDASAAKKLMTERSQKGYEYESIRESEVK